MAKNESISDLDHETLEQRLVETKQELFNLRFQHVTGQLENSSRLTHTKRQVARINTELRAREIAAAEALAAQEGNAS